MYYVCIENNQVTSVLNYRPNVPKGVDVVEISDSEHEAILQGSKVFNPDTRQVESKSIEVLAQETLEKQNAEHKEFLNNTDWKILRHLREKALGVSTSLSDGEYLDLEKQRDDAARAIK